MHYQTLWTPSQQPCHRTPGCDLITLDSKNPFPLLLPDPYPWYRYGLWLTPSEVAWGGMCHQQAENGTSASGFWHMRALQLITIGWAEWGNNNMPGKVDLVVKCMVCRWHVSYAGGMYDMQVAHMICRWHVWYAGGMYHMQVTCMVCRCINEIRKNRTSSVTSLSSIRSTRSCRRAAQYGDCLTQVCQALDRKGKKPGVVGLVTSLDVKNPKHFSDQDFR